MSATDLMTLPLSGLNLIEASAGTGKTYTISALILRLLIEQGCPVGSILVVTFSEAAAADLRRQVRERIRRAHAFFLDPEGEEGDDFLLRLAERVADRDVARRRLAAALQGFDEAAIHTIHGFCLRALQEESLAGRLLFDADLVPDSMPLVRQAACDFFRRAFAVKGPELAVLIGDSFLPDKAAGLVNAVPAGAAEIVPAPDPGAEARFLALTREAAAALDDLARAWPGWRRDVLELLGRAITDGQINRRTYKEGALEGWFAAVDEAVSGGLVGFLRGNGLPPQLCAETLAGKTNKGRTPPEHPFFHLASRLNRVHGASAALRDRLRIDYAVRFVREAGEEMDKSRREQGSLGFDDLLVALNRALGDDPGLAATLRRRYPFAFIDEFQDTDYLQFAIFRTVYGRAEDGLLYLIGDPKQSIYSFRGADLKVYLAARRLAAGRESSLDRNYRSTPAMVRAVNRVFTFRNRPFLLEGMGELPAVESADAVDGRLEVEGDSDAALRIVLCNRPEDAAAAGRPLDQQRSETLVCDWLVAEITRLLSLGRCGRARIGKRNLASGDIAVLVRNNSHAHLVQKRLARAGVASVLFSGESVLASREAADLLTLLSAVAAPGDLGRVRAALLTPFMGKSVEDIRALDEDGGWDQWLERFRSWRELWQRHGPLRMLRGMARECGIKTRLAAMSMGERRLTNFFHLAEILEARSGRGRAGIREGLAILAAGPGDGRDDESQLRLESDADCVQIITMHKSKGLQYPVVFCPFLWWARSGPRKENGAPPHPMRFQAGEGSPPGVDFGSPDYENRAAAARVEELAETIRLAYVALTRAVHRCYVAWGVLGSNPGMTAPAYLFHRQVSDEWPAGGRNLLVGLGEEGIRADLEELAGNGGEIEIAGYPDEVDRAVAPQAPEKDSMILEARKFPGRVVASWRGVSFSAIVHGSGYGPHPAAAGGDGAGERGLDGFPRGTRAGLFFHSVLEEIDFSDSSGWAETVARLLGAYGFSGDWAGAVLDMLGRLVDMPLGPGGERLALVRPESRLSELEFLFPCGFSPAGLASLFSTVERGWAGGFSERVARLPEERLAGFMRGFIDLVFEQRGRYFIVDWKSNHLGCGPEAYGEMDVEQAMIADAYILQYHIYAAALHKHLAARLPEYSYDKHFGGVFYPFLRGVANHGPGAIFHDRPDPEFMERFVSLLEGQDTGERKP